MTLTAYQIIELALQRAKLRRIYKNRPTPPKETTKCIKCDRPTTVNRFGKPICVCQYHYKIARENRLCNNCYDKPKHQDQCYCLDCKRTKDYNRNH